jgi:ABC-type polysaccharide/polyol phosphate transport system ATPase subunit
MDEVLAVGDQAFQTKCRERFEAFRASGTAIVLVSHDQRLVAATCQRAVWLERGEVRQSGPVTEVVAAYAGPS